MGTPKGGGDKPSNLGLSDFKVLPEQRGVGPRAQKPEEPKQQPAAAERLGKSPVEEAASKLDNPVQEQVEPQAGEQEDAEEIDFPLRVFPSATYVGPFGRKSAKKPKND